MPAKPVKYFISAWILTLAACQAVILPSSTPTSEQDAYHASISTISAQLTGIAGTSGPQPPTNPTPTFTAAPTETLPPTSTPLPTQTLIPTETPFPTDPPAPASLQTQEADLTEVPGRIALIGTREPDWFDTFENGGANWALYNDEHVTMQIENNLLVMTALTANRKDPYDAWMITPVDITNFYLEVKARPGKCTGLDRYGVLVRAAQDASTAYVFGFSCDGKYSLRIWNGENYRMLKEWTVSQFIQNGPDGSNRIGIRAIDDRFTLYANDQQLTEIQDGTYTSGAVGLFVGAVFTDEFQTAFEQVSWWLLP